MPGSVGGACWAFWACGYPDIVSVLHPALDVLAQAPILTVFLVIGLGTAVGQIPLGPIRFGAAGALFVGPVSYTHLTLPTNREV